MSRFDQAVEDFKLMLYAARAMRSPTLEHAALNLLAKIYTALSEKDLAFSWLERGLQAGAIGLFFKDEPVWDPIRRDPRFANLLRRMGIPQ